MPSCLHVQQAYYVPAAAARRYSNAHAVNTAAAVAADDDEDDDGDDDDDAPFMSLVFLHQCKCKSAGGRYNCYHDIQTRFTVYKRSLG